MYFSDDETIAPVIMLVRDNFADDNMIGWTLYADDWSAMNQRLTTNSAEGGAAMLDTNFTDLVFDTTVAVVEGSGDAGLMFRATNLSDELNKLNEYYAKISPTGSVMLDKFENGVQSIIVSATLDIVIGREYHLRVTAKIYEIDIFVNDMEASKLGAVDASFLFDADGVRASGADAKFGAVSINKL